MRARVSELRTIDRPARLPWTSAPVSDLSEGPNDRVGDRHPVPLTTDALDRFVPGVAGRVAATIGQSTILRLVGDLAARLATIEPGKMDDALTASLRRISDELRLDRAVLWQRAASDASAASRCWTGNPHPCTAEALPLASMPLIASKLLAGEAVWFTRIGEVCEVVDRRALHRYGLRSAVLIPLPTNADASGIRGAVAFGSTTVEREWPAEMLEPLRLIAAIFGQALACKASLDALQQARDELHAIRERPPQVDERCGSDASEPRALLRTDFRDSGREAREPFRTGPIVGGSAAIRRVLEQARQVAATDATVLLQGETGTGKELIASYIHDLSARRSRMMTRVNCSAIPTTLIESELFGREKGAFTGALSRQVGRFELADRSTIFLDEIGDLAADIQVKLLRVLENRQIERLGSPKPVRVDVRIIAATHRDLEKLIVEDAFREDLYYRLNVFPIRVPPLRDRTEDIPLLVWRFVEEFSKSFGKRIGTISSGTMTRLQQYAWPGNIRELRNVVERAMIVATGPTLTIALPSTPTPGVGRTVKMVDVEREHLQSVLESTGWRIRGVNGAADQLGLRPTTLETRMARLGLSRPKRP